MTTLAIVLSALLALACVSFAARAFLGSGPNELASLTPAQAARLALVEERDRLLAALHELEFDHVAGTISDADYRTQVGPLRADVARVLAELDTGDGSPGTAAG